MQGRWWKNIPKMPVAVLRPLKDRVISDFDTTQAMIHHFIKSAHSSYIKGVLRFRNLGLL